ncbi:MAG TPA: tripartite tricarboxylate transporter substrate-binding protein [Beijerinckiaceae bacterium]|jgi:tripartite-type tricarboxylate transporter receptor subunit TctC|nr:tripartite tricarboxylate transporter substrate-binding protein [Beijerinckiaceae bacterium]
MKHPVWLAALGLLAQAMTMTASSSQAASVEDFYKGKQITLYIGSEAGAGYDIYGRSVARFIGKHIPGNPAVVPENMPGAGSLTLTNFMYAKAPRDGTAIAGIQNATALEPTLGDKNARFKASDFTWLGSVNEQTNVCISWAASGVKTLGDVQKKEFLVGVVPSTSTDTVANLLNDLTGTKLKLIRGYPSTGAVLLAMERGEVGGLCGIGLDSVQSSMRDDLQAGKINIFAQIGPQKNPDIPNVSFVYDYLKDQSDKSLLDFLVGRMLMGRPFLAPPGLPPDRAEALRKAFWDTVHDPDFLADAKKIDMPVLPDSGEKVQEIVRHLESASPEIISRGSKILGINQN